MNKNTRQILNMFADYFLPQEIAVAEEMVSRFIAGEDVRYIASDYNKPEQSVVAAIRFFYLKARGNGTVRKVYDDYRRRAFVGEKEGMTETLDA